LKLFRSFSLVLAGALCLSSVARSISASAGSPQPCKKLALSVRGVVRSWTPPSRRLFNTAKVGPPLRLIGLNEGSSPTESAPRKILSPDKQMFVLSTGSLAGIVQVMDVVSRFERTLKVVDSPEQAYEIFGWLDGNTVVVRVGTFSDSVIKLVSHKACPCRAPRFENLMGLFVCTSPRKPAWDPCSSIHHRFADP
jgi:hypothetical protein